jgi:hypothetical protein
MFHTSKFSSQSDAVKNFMFPALCMELCTQTSHFTVSSARAGRLACIYKSTQRSIACVYYHVPDYEGAYEYNGAVGFKKNAADMSCTNLGACMEAHSAHTGVYLSSSSYEPRLVRVVLRSRKT